MKSEKHQAEKFGIPLTRNAIGNQVQKNQSIDDIINEKNNVMRPKRIYIEGGITEQSGFSLSVVNRIEGSTLPPEKDADKRMSPISEHT